MTGDRPADDPALAKRRLHELLRRSDHVLGTTRAPIEAPEGTPGPSSLARLLELAQTMNRMRERDELLAYIRDRMSELFDAENSVVILVGRDGALRVLDGTRDGRREISETLVRRVIAKRRPILVRDASQDPELQTKESVLELGLVSVLCAPLIVEGEVIGVIEFDHRNQPKRFSNEDLVLLELFANQAATALDNVLLSERRSEAEHKMREAQAALLASERLRALGQMAAGVAHDFNNLLASVLGLSELLLRHPHTTDDLKPTVERLHACALDGAGTVARIQEFAGGGAAEGEPGAIAAHAVLDDVAGALSHRFDAEGWTLRIEHGDCPPILGRFADLRDVMQNLVLNAMDAMPGGGVVTLRSLSRDGRPVLEVEDTGAGIDPAVRERIFEPFFTTKNGRGHGLGLAICWSIVNRMGGVIDARSAPERGTVFVLELTPAPTGTATSPPSAAPDPDASARRGRLLLVEDDPTVREVLGCMLRMLEHDVTEAQDGPEALALIEQQAFDVVITDHGMPGMNGVELAAAAHEIRA